MNADQLALQLYTVREELQANPEQTLSAVAHVGYRHVELAGTAGLEPARFRELLDGAGLRALGAHVGLDKLERIDEALAQADTLGYRLLIVPWVAEDQRGGHAAGVALGSRLGGIAETIAKDGYRLAYHNHEFEFDGSPGERLWDGLIATLPPEVRLEVDVCWVRVADVDPVTLLDRLTGRVVSLHMKDVDPAFRRPRIPGSGVLPWREIVEAGDRSGVEWYVVEEDDPADALDSAAVGYDFVRGLAE